MLVVTCFLPSAKAFNCEGLKSSGSKRSVTWWAMMWPPSCPGELLLSTATQKTTPLNLMKMTGQINSAYCPHSSFCSPHPPSQIQTVTVSCGEGRKDKELQGAKAFSGTTKDLSECFLQTTIHFFPVPSCGLLRAVAELIPLPLQ